MNILTLAWRFWRSRALAYRWPAAWRTAVNHIKHRNNTRDCR